VQTAADPPIEPVLEPTAETAAPDIAPSRSVIEPGTPPRPTPTTEPTTMHAAVVERYGAPEVVRVVEVARPRPGRDQVLVRVMATTVNSGDARLRGARFPSGFAPFARLAFGITRPRRKVLGSCVSGVIEAVGERVEGWAPGDVVCAMTGMAMGGHAQFVAIPATKLVRTPVGVSHDDAAGVLFGGTTALHFLRTKASVGTGASVLVNGASGALGTNAVQLARHFGATVTAVCSAANADLVRSLGADAVIDHTTMRLDEITDRYDIVFDTVGNISVSSGRRLLRPGGRLLLAVAGLGETLRAHGQVAAGPAPEDTDDIEFLLRLVAAGELAVVHETVLPLTGIVHAHRLVDSGRKRGNITIRP
jgi:NADPH:quinone reductase-like Zn-dependent oxidoreductase